MTVCTRIIWSPGREVSFKNGKDDHIEEGDQDAVLIDSSNVHLIFIKSFGIFPVDHMKLLKSFVQKSNLFVCFLGPASVILVGVQRFYTDSGHR